MDLNSDRNERFCSQKNAISYHGPDVTIFALELEKESQDKNLKERNMVKVTSLKWKLTQRRILLRGL